MMRPAVQLIYKIDQRWVKNNRDPENIVFGTALQEHNQLIYDDTAFLLSIAFADKALFGFDTLADLQTQEIPLGDDQLVLRWRESALDKPILRRCTKAGGIGDEPMPEQAFKEILKSTLRNAGYSISYPNRSMIRCHRLPSCCIAATRARTRSRDLANVGRPSMKMRSTS